MAENLVIVNGVSSMHKLMNTCAPVTIIVTNRKQEAGQTPPVAHDSLPRCLSFLAVNFSGL